MAYLPMIDAQLGRHRWDGHRRRRGFLPLERHNNPDGGVVWARPEGGWNAPEAAAARHKTAVEFAERWRRFSVQGYNMGDERATLGMCLHPACWKTYRDYLAGQYTRIDALNEAWGTSFDSFNQIDPVIDSAWPIEKAGEAMAYVAENRNIGKVLLQVAG